MTAVVVKKPELEIKVKAVSLKSYWLTLGEIRLDASFYAEESQRAIRFLKESGYETTNIGSLSKRVFNPPPIKRQYSGIEGTPYLMPTELFLLRLEPTKFVFANKMENIEDWFVKDKWVILTQSGNTGMPLYVTESLEEFVVSQNAIRIIPKDDVYSGFLYAYLSTWLGQALVTRDQFGVTVEHIRPHHVSQVLVPSIPEEIQKQVHRNIVKVFQLRDKAREFLKQAERMLFQELNLTPIKSSLKETKTFSVGASKLNLRFDASYHDPIADNIVSKLQKSGYTLSPLSKVSDAFIPSRFKRIYVEEEYGLPFLQGTDISLIKPRLLKYISEKVTENIEKWIVHSGWVLVTRSGTVGRVSLVPKQWDGWAVSEHVLRIISNLDKINSGFLTIFLTSDYGYRQVISKIYGGVVDELSEDDLKDVLVPLPPLDVQENIGKLVLEAYEMKELANKIEDDTTYTLEDMLTKHRKTEDAVEYLKEIEAYAETFDLIGDEEFRESLEQAERGEVVPFEGSEKEQ